MGSFSLLHWLIIGFVLMVLFGPNRLAASGKSLGTAIRSFRSSLSELDDKPDRDEEPPPKKRIKAPKPPEKTDIDDDGSG